MIEVVFSESAAGSLKMAQRYGEGEYKEWFVWGTISGDTPLSEEDLARIKKEHEARARADWEEAVPLGGNGGDVFCLGISLSIGNIAEDTAPNRLEVLNALFKFYPANVANSAAKEMIAAADKNLAKVRERFAKGETMRIWYSDNPDEMSGLYWLMAQIKQWRIAGEIYLVKLPSFYEEKQSVVYPASWGEIPPGKWHKFIPSQQKASELLVSSLARRWQELQTENAPLRAVINGKIQSVAEDFYDSFIRQILAQLEDEFHEAQLIGKILGHYQLGISDGWLALRIEKMIASGELMPLSEALPEEPFYRRTLKKMR